MNWDPSDLQDAEDKTHMLRFLPYLETLDGKPVETVIGYTPTWVRRGRGYGRWEEFFHTLDEAQARLHFLVDARVIEDAEIRKEVPGGGRLAKLVEEWSDVTNPE
jgi:hypothetical protein